jgi:NAD+ kinase
LVAPAWQLKANAIAVGAHRVGESAARLPPASPDTRITTSRRLHAAEGKTLKPRVLVVCKLSVLENMAARMGAGGVRSFLDRVPDVRGRYETADRENRSTSETVTAVLKRLGIPFDVTPRPLTEGVEGFDLVVTVGGDGTFLDASHLVDATPMLGVNSAPSTSVGHFCRAREMTFEEVFCEVLSEAARPARVFRIEVEVDGVVVAPPVLNDALFSHSIPAGTSRYLLELGRRSERHKSSGLWVSTAAGSTGAIQSAGGAGMEVADNPLLQYRVREPYNEPWHEPTMLGGVEQGPLRLRNLTTMASLFIDGPRNAHRLTIGSEVVFHPGRRPLMAYLPE